MIIGIGIDLVVNERFAGVLERRGERIKKRLFTPVEKEYCDAKKFPSPHYAARFAAKEAVMKALGTGMKGVLWKEIEIRNDPAGKPEVTLSGKAAERFEKLSGKRILVSLTHSEHTSGAVAVIEGGK